MTGATARQGDFLGIALANQLLIDKFGAVIGIQSQQWKGQVGANVSQRGENVFLGFGHYGAHLRPPKAHVRDIQRASEETARISAVMLHQVDRLETGVFIIPIRKGANREETLPKVCR